MNDVTPTWHVQRSEVIVPQSYHLVGFLVMGMFAMSLAGAGVIYSVWRWVRR